MPPTSPETLKVTIPSHTSYLHLVTSLARNAATAAGFDDPEADKIAIATDEAVTNIIQHAYHGRDDGTIELLVQVDDNGIEIRVIHDGEPLDTSKPRPDFDPEVHIKNRRTGGIGIVLMQRLMDEVDFRRTDDERNECCLRKKRSPSATPGSETPRAGKA